MLPTVHDLSLARQLGFAVLHILGGKAVRMLRMGHCA
jgi:hypothetical protein